MSDTMRQRRAEAAAGLRRHERSPREPKAAQQAPAGPTVPAPTAPPAPADRREAIAARFAQTSGRSIDEMRSFAQFLKADAFADDAGDVDEAAVDAYAQRAFGGTQAPAADPVRDAVGRSAAPGSRPHAATSPSGRREEVRDQMMRKGSQR